MRIAVDSLGDNPVELEEDIPALTWNINSLDVKFIGNIHLNCKFTKISREIIVEITVDSVREIVCARCLRQVEKTQRQNFKRDYNIDSLKEFLDIDSDVREEMLLDFPMKVLCRPDCKGMCFGCGVDLNSESCRCGSRGGK